MRRAFPRRGGQRGIALLALVAVLVIGGTWYLVSRLQETQGRSVLESVDVESLTDILTGKAAPPA